MLYPRTMRFLVSTKADVTDCSGRRDQSQDGEHGAIQGVPGGAEAAEGGARGQPEGGSVPRTGVGERRRRNRGVDTLDEEGMRMGVSQYIDSRCRCRVARC